MILKKTLLLAIVLLASVTAHAQWQTITNGNLWKDTKGNDVQAHAPGFLQVGDRWYMVGEDRSNQWNPDVNMYSTKDFQTWKFEGKVIGNGVSHPSLGTDRMIERAKLLYCPKTKKYVMWMHWEALDYSASEAAVFVADKVTGPYKYHWSGRPMGIKSRDCNVFVDDDGTAYFISTTEENQHLGLFRLSDDYLSVVEHTQLCPYKRREAPAIVKVQGIYYMISSACSGWDSNQAQLATSKSLTSGWTDLVDVGNPNSWDTQAAAILTFQGTKATTYVYVGDRWQDPALPESKTIMFPVSFKMGRMTFDYQRQWDLDIKTGKWRATPRTDLIPKDQWRLLYASSQDSLSTAANAFDGDAATLWLTSQPTDSAYLALPDSAQMITEGQQQGPPIGRDGRPFRPDMRHMRKPRAIHHELQIDMGATYNVSGLIVTPRQDNTLQGVIRDYELYLSNDGQTWGEPVSKGWMTWDTEISFPTTNARYVRLVALSEYSRRDVASMAELTLVQSPE